MIREFRQLFKREELKISITACFIIAVVGFLSSLPMARSMFASELPSAAHGAMIFNNQMGQAFSAFLLPLICSFCYADSYYMERKSGYWIAVRSRLSKSAYMWKKAIVVTISSFFIAMLPFLINQLLCFAFFPLTSTYDMFASTKGTVNFPNLYENMPYLNNMVYILLNGIYGGVLGLLAFAFSLYIKKSRVVTLVATTIFMILSYFLVGLPSKESYVVYNYLYSAPLHFYVEIYKFFVIIAVLLIISLVGICLKLRKDEI